MSEVTEEIKHVPLEEIHAALGAKMVPFAGYMMPVRYSSDIEEHMTVRNAAGMFDVSHMGEFILKGPKALDVIQQITTNDASVLPIGKVQYTALTNPEGGIIDDLLVYHTGDNEYYIVVNASNIEKDKAWFLKHLPAEGVDFQDISEDTCLFAVQGPRAHEVLAQLTSYPVKDMEYYTCAHMDFAGYKNVFVSATGYTGAGGFEIYIPNAIAKDVWNKLMKAGELVGMKPVGLGARDTLRLEMGYCLYGNDITDTTSPLEAGLGWVTKFTKKFTASDILQVQKATGVTRQLVGFEMVERGIPRGHYELMNAAGEKIGEVTSGTQSPCLGIGIGMGYVEKAYSAAGSEIFVHIRGKLIKAKVVKFPFVKK
ncbi:glycine cleavage system aminomethyltransferase GcvT [Cytophaga aurantiaca]|uniref:glycine cleavage system aminomethyltransferase GcvT n=1 Tax=Cytophaga aurantiaca TaxID=29530 RepID=UPI0003794CDE|nr:glycine cleavage system aminomethyltransferase GcvT [Cytophaga aurantiaca]